MRFALIVVLAVAAAPLADAQEGTAYYGLSLGSFDYDEPDPSGILPISDSADSYRLMVGYLFNDHFGFEGAWGKAGDIRATNTVNTQSGPVTLDLTTELEFLTLRLVGVLPFDSGVTLLGGIGYSEIDQDYTIDVTGVAQVSSDFDLGPMTYFAGVQYDWDRVAMRLAYEKYDFDEDIDGAEVSVSFFYKL
jgi:opacity protein-like surface antigen